MGLNLSFLLLVLGVLALFVLALRPAVKAEQGKVWLHRRQLLIALFFWLALSGSLAGTGVLLDFSLPKLPILVAIGLCLTTAFAISSFGKELANNIPIWLLVGINGFRLPLELLMHRAADEGVMPPQMSFSGRNFDIVTGILAFIVSYLAYRAPKENPPLLFVRFFNLIGLGLLFNVVSIAILSMPLPIRVYMNEPANTWIAHLPFVWLPTFLVPLALFSHLLILRRLMSEAAKSKTLKSIAPSDEKDLQI